MESLFAVQLENSSVFSVRLQNNHTLTDLAVRVLQMTRHESTPVSNVSIGIRGEDTRFPLTTILSDLTNQYGTVAKPLLITVPPNLPVMAGYIERECAPINTVLGKCDSSYNTAFVGPKGSGKSTTLQRVYETALGQGKKAVYVDLKAATNIHFQPSSHLLKFVDNAQCLQTEEGKWLCNMQSIIIVVLHSPLVWVLSLD